LTNKWNPALFYLKRKPKEKNRERKEENKENKNWSLEKHRSSPPSKKA
jgi:hypothetical protein